MKRARIVIGANFGDEGKGLVTDYLAAQGAGVIIRFNGGAQAGHTVVTPEGNRHVFHHFGSGSFLGIPTFLSQFFLGNPILFFQELAELSKSKACPEPKVFAHPDMLITTFADMLINQQKEKMRGGKRHGSVGVGVHETMQRSRVESLKITMADLWNGSKRLESQLNEICDRWAKFRVGEPIPKVEEAIAHFILACNKFAEMVHPAGIGQCKEPIFEGAQGLLLSQDNEDYKPHLTHSYTGMKNVRILCDQGGFDEKEIYYVSRTYLTRHGEGKLPGEDKNLFYPDNTNIPHAFQGTLRFAPLDIKSLRERIAKDAQGEYKLILTHCDQKSTEEEADLYSYGPTRNDLKSK